MLEKVIRDQIQNFQFGLKSQDFIFELIEFCIGPGVNPKFSEFNAENLGLNPGASQNDPSGKINLVPPRLFEQDIDLWDW